MKKDVLISLKGHQRYVDGEKDEIEFVTEGTFYKKKDKYFITYNESEVTGLDGTTTTLKVDDDIVTLSRYGSNNSQLVFEKGKKHSCFYDTEAGSLVIGVYSNKVSIDLSDMGGNLEVDYDIEINNNLSGNNDFSINVKEVEEDNDKS